MAPCKPENRKIIVAPSAGFICFCAATVLISIGGIFYVEDKSKVSNYVNTMCYIRHVSWNTYRCILYFAQTACYVATWSVHYRDYTSKSGTVEGTKRYRDSSDAFDEAKTYPGSSSHPCWLDTRNSSVAQWNQPSTEFGVILLSFGGVSALLSIIFFYLTYLLLKQRRRQKEQSSGARVNLLVF